MMHAERISGVAKQMEAGRLNSTLGKVCGLQIHRKPVATRCVQTIANDQGVRQCKPEIDMDSMIPRCRHLRVKWLTSHSCQCANCGKHGHWYENEGLVMWVRQESKCPTTIASPASPGTFVDSRSLHPLPSRAG